MVYIPLPRIPLAIHDILDGIISPTPKGSISDIAYDSRKVTPNSLWVCAVPFVNRDGHEVSPLNHLDEAVSRGATVIILPSGTSSPTIPSHLTVIHTPDPRSDLEKIATRAYGTPASGIFSVGITGTKGKTTTAWLIHHLLQYVGEPTGLIGTSDYKIGCLRIPNPTPTINDTYLSCPEALELQGFLYHMKQEGVRAVVIEATSHALALSRVSGGSLFDVGIITNLHTEHLDFHGSLEAYRDAKARIIDIVAGAASQGKKGILILNADCPSIPYFERYAADRAKLLTFGISSVQPTNSRTPDYQAGNISSTPKGTSFILRYGDEKPLEVFVPLRYKFNIYNTLAALATVHQGMDVPLNYLIDGLASFTNVPGRQESVINPLGISIIVDYAHTPESLAGMLEGDNDSSRTLLVLSCTGSRDSTKRPLMGAIAAKHAYFTVITNDSTHDEDPLKILREIEEGYRKISQENYVVIDDRRAAIGYALKTAHISDRVIIVGMGPETILQRGDTTVPWSDGVVARELGAHIARERNVTNMQGAQP